MNCTVSVEIWKHKTTAFLVKIQFRYSLLQHIITALKTFRTKDAATNKMGIFTPRILRTINNFFVQQIP